MWTAPEVPELVEKFGNENLVAGSSASCSPHVEARLSVTASMQNPCAILLRFSIASTRCTVARSGMPSLLLRGYGGPGPSNFVELVPEGCRRD